MGGAGRGDPRGSTQAQTLFIWSGCAATLGRTEDPGGDIVRDASPPRGSETPVNVKLFQGLGKCPLFSLVSWRLSNAHKPQLGCRA